VVACRRRPCGLAAAVIALAVIALTVLATAGPA